MAEEETQSLFTQCVVPCVSKASIHPSIGPGKHITRYNSGVKCSLSSQTVASCILVHSPTRMTFIFVKTIVDFDAMLRFARIHGHDTTIESQWVLLFIPIAGQLLRSRAIFSCFSSSTVTRFAYLKIFLVVRSSSGNLLSRHRLVKSLAPAAKSEKERRIVLICLSPSQRGLSH